MKLATRSVLLAVWFAWALLGFAGPAMQNALASQPSQALIDAANKEGEVVVWSHTWEKGAANSFEKRYPSIRVKVWDSRVEEIVTKTVTEAKAGRFSADVILIVDRGMPTLKDAGLLREYDWPEHLKRWAHQPKHRFWANYVIHSYVPSYNTRLISAAEAPKSWDDLNNPKWAGKTILSYSGGDAPLLFAHLWRKKNEELNWEKAFGFWSEVIKTTQPKVSRGFHQPTELLAGGEFSLMLLNAISVVPVYVQRGAPIKMVPVGKHAASSWSVAMPKTVPHPNAAKLFIDHLMSEEGLLDYANAHHTPVLDPEVARKAKPNTQLKASGVELYPLPEELVTNENMQKATHWWLDTLGVRRR